MAAKKEEPKTYSQEEVADLMFNMVKVNSHTEFPSPRDLRGQISRAISGGFGFDDTMHNIFLDYGYPDQLTFSMLWNMYRRFGIAKNGVEIFPKIGWMDPPTIESSEKVKKGIEDLVEKFQFWNRLKGLDTRQRVGQYAGMFMRVRDNKKPDQPIEGVLPGFDALVDMIPLYEGQLTVQDTNTTETDDDFGKPTMYLFQGGGTAGNRNPFMNASFSIHPSRIVIAAEGSDNGGIYGIPAMEAGYNSLMDLRKIIGAGGEGFYRNASQSIIFNASDPDNIRANTAILDKFNEQFDEFTMDRMRKALWTPGLEAKAIESHLIQADTFFNNAANDAAAGFEIPVTILIGQQTGRLASGEDIRALLASVQSRRENFQTVMTRDVIDWLMEFGILPMADYDVEQEDALALSNSERLDNVVKMADINGKNFMAGGGLIFSDEVMIEASGNEVEELPDDPPEGEDDNNGEDDNGNDSENE